MDEIRLVDVEGEPTKRRRVATYHMVADLKNYNYVGRLITKAQEVDTYSANADGSCCYLADSA